MGRVMVVGVGMVGMREGSEEGTVEEAVGEGTVWRAPLAAWVGDGGQEAGMSHGAWQAATCDTCAGDGSAGVTVCVACGRLGAPCVCRHKTSAQRPCPDSASGLAVWISVVSDGKCSGCWEIWLCIEVARVAVTD